MVHSRNSQPTGSISRYYHYSAHSVADCMEDVALLAPTWEKEKAVEETSQEKVQDEEIDKGGEEATGRDENAASKDEL